VLRHKVTEEFPTEIPPVYRDRGCLSAAMAAPFAHSPRTGPGMTERQFAISGRWALAADSLQWMLQRRAGQQWRSVSFVSSTQDVLVRCRREKGCPPADAERLLAGLPSTFEEWARKHVQTPITADLADGGGPPLGSVNTALPANERRDRDPESAR